MTLNIVIPEDCKFLEYVGSGSYGDVCKCFSQKLHRIVAVKRIKMSTEYTSIPPTTIREIAVLKQIQKQEDNENIIQLLDINFDKRNFFLLFQYCEYDMDKYLHKLARKLTLQEAKRFMHQLLRGLNCIHSAQCIHRDIKLNNLLLKQRLLQRPTTQQQDEDSDPHTQYGELGDYLDPCNFDLKITDFGLARTYAIEGSVGTNVVTLWYRAPELILNHKNYGPRIDAWSAGCCMYSFLTSRPLFPAENDLDLLRQICSILGGPNVSKLWRSQDCCDRRLMGLEFEPATKSEVFPEIDDLGWDLFKQLLDVDCDRRITCADALKHSWFDDV